MNADAIVSAIRGVILGELGEVRTVPPGDWIEGQPAQYGVHGGLDGDTARRLRASGQRLFDAEIAPARRTGAVGSSAAAQAIHSLEVRIVLWLPIALVADTASTAHRRSVRAEMMAQARTITDALEWPGNLTRDPEGTDTGLVSGMLREAAAPRIVREDWSAGLYEIELRMTGLVHETREIIPAPVFTRAPAIYVADGTDPEVGATLIADPGIVTGAHTERGQWLRDGAPIEGATGVSYTLVAADEGASITYRATAIGSGGTTTAESNTIEVGGSEPPVTLESQIIAEFAAPGWTAHFIGLLRDESDVSLVGPAIAALFDRSGYANHAQQAATARPAYSATAINGLPGITLDGGDYLVTPEIDLSGATAAVLMILMSDADTTGKIPVEWGTTGSASTAGGIAIITNDGGAGGLGAYGRRDASASSARSAASYPMTSPAVVTATWDLALEADETEIRHGGVNVTLTRPGSGNNTGTLGSAKLSIGARDGGTSGMTGAIGAVVLAAGAGPISGDVIAAIANVEALLAASKGL